MERAPKRERNGVSLGETPAAPSAKRMSRRRAAAQRWDRVPDRIVRASAATVRWHSAGPDVRPAAVPRMASFGEACSYRQCAFAALMSRSSSSEGLRPSDSPTPSLARRFAASLRSGGSLRCARSRPSVHGSRRCARSLCPGCGDLRWLGFAALARCAQVRRSLVARVATLARVPALGSRRGARSRPGPAISSGSRRGAR